LGWSSIFAATGPTGPAFECRCNYSEYYITDGTFTTSTHLNTINSSTADTVGSFPLVAGPMIAANPQNGLLYLRESDSHVAVFDPRTQTVVDTIIPSLSIPLIFSLAVDPALHHLYIFEEAGVLVYDTDTNTQIDFISAPGTIAFGTPNGLVDPVTHNLVLFYGGYPTGCGNVVIITPAGSFVANNPNFCGDYKDAAFSADGQTLYSIASNLQSPDYMLHTLDTGTGAANAVSLPSTTIRGIGVNSKNGLVYLADPSNGIYVYDPSSGTFDGPYSVGGFGNVTSSLGVTFDPNTDQILVRSTSLLKIVDADTMALVGDAPAQVPAGSFQRAVVLVHSDPCCGATGATGPTGPAGAGACGGPAYAFFATDSGTGEGLWTRFEPNSEEIEVSAGAPPDIRYTAADLVLGNVYATSLNHNWLAIYENGAWSTRSIGYSLGRPVVNTASHLVYIPNTGMALVHVYDGVSDQILPDIVVTGTPQDLAIDPDGNRMFLATGVSVEVYDLRGNYQFSIDTPSIQLKANPCNGDLYAVVGNSIEVFDGKTGGLKRTLDVDAVYFDIDTGTNQLAAWTHSQHVAAYDLCSGELQWDEYRGIPDYVALGITVDPVNHLAYFANDLTAVVEVYSMANGTSTANITANSMTSNVAVMACGGGCRLCCDPCAGSTGPSGCTITGNAYALLSDAIAVIDSNTHQQVDAIGLNPSYGSLPALNAFAVNPSNGQFYVGTINGLYRFDAQGNEVDRVLESNDITDVVYNPTSNKIYLVDASLNEVAVYDAATLGLLNTFSASNSSMILAVDPVTNQVFAVMPGSGIDVIDGETDNVNTTIPATVIYHLAIDPSRHRLYTCDYNGLVRIYDTRSYDEVGSIGLSSGPPMDFAINPNTNWLYANYGTHIDVLNAADGNLADTISMENISTVAVNPVSNQVYYFTGGDLTIVLDGKDNRELGNIPMTGVIAYDFSTREVCGGECGIFVADGTDEQVSDVLSNFGYVRFDDTQIDLGGNVTTPDGMHFTIRTPGIYEISVRVPIRSTQNPLTGDYQFYYAVNVNGSAIYAADWHNRYEQNWQQLVTGFSQLFRQLNAGDEISVPITTYFSTDTGSDHFENQSIAIHKIC